MSQRDSRLGRFYHSGLGADSSSWDKNLSAGGWYSGHEPRACTWAYHAGPFAGLDPQKYEVGPCTYNDTSGPPLFRCNALPCNLTYGPVTTMPIRPLSSPGPIRAFVGYDAGDGANNL
jgi:hypothetical protein